MYKTLTVLLLAVAPALAQVSPIIDRTDMPAPSATAPVDTLRLSVARPVLPAGTSLLSQRGANQTWNYAGLVPTSQRVEQFVTVNSLAATAPIYTLYFGAFGGVNQATVASPQALFPAGFPVPLADTYQFYNASAASNDFRSVGFGGSLGGAAIPVAYASQDQQDVIYRFPLSYASKPDSSSSYFATPAAAASAGYISQKRKRVNRPDAWGTLTTPFGTFQTVRVVTRLQDHDSLSFGGQSQGFDLPITRQYKWLAKMQHVPLLTITTQELAGREVVTSVEYRDRYRRLIRLGTHDAATDAALTVFPNPSAAGSPLTLTVPLGSGPVTVSATDVAGRQLFRRSFAGSTGSFRIGDEAFGDFRGVALLTLTTSQGTTTRRVMRE